MLKKYFFVIAILFAGCSILADNADASFTLTWNFAGEIGSQASQSGTSSNPLVTADAITRNGLSPATSMDTFTSSNWSTTAYTDYLEFGLNIDAGNTADLSSLQFVGQSSSGGPKDLALRWSVDNYASDIFVLPQITVSGVNINADLSSLGPVSGNIDFRIYNTSGAAVGGGLMPPSGTFSLGTNANSIMTLSGVVNTPTAVPEPTSLLMVAGAGLAGFVGVRRRKRKALAAA